MWAMSRSTSFKLLCFLVLVGAAFMASTFGATTTNFSGHWALKIGNRTLMALTLTREPGNARQFTGWLSRPTKFESSGAGNFFSNIKGPTIRYHIIESNVTGHCLAFTTQNPANKTDLDHFRLCSGTPSHATLAIDIPTFEPWPVTKEKGSVIVATDWDSARTYYLDETEVSN